MGTKHSITYWPSIRGYLLLPHAVPTMVVLVATSAFAFIATEGNPGPAPLASLLIAMLGSQLAIGATNELVDVELDRTTKPHKPIPSGLVSMRGARTVVVVGLALVVLGSLRFSLLAFLLCGLGTAIGIAYSLWFKRTVLSWLPYVLAIPLLPIWVWEAMADLPAGLTLLYPIAIPALIAVHIAQSIPDLDGDRSAGIKNLTVGLGEKGARLACWGLMIVSISAAVITASSTANNPLWCQMAGIAALGLIAVNAFVWHQDAARGEQSCFPLMAAAVVVIGVGWSMSTLT